MKKTVIYIISLLAIGLLILLTLPDHKQQITNEIEINSENKETTKSSFVIDSSNDIPEVHTNKNLDERFDKKNQRIPIEQTEQVLPYDLQQQLDNPNPELPEDLKQQLITPVDKLPDDMIESMKTPPRIVPIEEVNDPNYERPIE